MIADTIEKDLTDEEDRSLSIQALEACRSRLVEQDHIDLSAFDSLENAADIEDLRMAMGYDKINYYGVSYGTLLGLHLMDQYPASIRSVVLDAVVPPQTNFLLNSAQTMDASFTRLFEACKESIDCSKNYPDLEDEFFKVVESLDKQPARIELTDPETSKTYNESVIDGNAFINTTFQMLYVGSLIPALPRMIYDARDGDFRFFGKIYSVLLFDRSMSIGMYYSVICSEDADFLPDDYDLSGVRPQLARAESYEAEDLLKICSAWSVQSLDASVDKPVHSTIPTLLLSGGFDPITPPSYAQEAASTLENSYSLIFPAGGHGQALEGECENGIINAFLDDPTNPPDQSCIEQSTSFYSPINTLDFPIGLELLNLSPKTKTALLTLVSSWICAASAVPVFPIIWLVTYFRRKKKKNVESGVQAEEISSGEGIELSDVEKAQPAANKCTRFSGAAGWLAFAAGTLISIFITGLTYVLVDMAVQNDNRLFFGLRASALPLFMIPWIIALFWVGMILLGVRSWLCKHWSIWTRIYFSVITISLGICLLTLINIGVFTTVIQRFFG